MQYGILKRPNSFVELSEETYRELRFATDSAFELLFLEEKFDYLLSNYYELERELLAIAGNYMIFTPLDDFWFVEQRAIVSRRLANFLTTARMYCDHTRHHLKRLFLEGSKEFKELSKLFSREYDSVLEYRVMEALRNHVQHRGFAIHSLEFKRDWIGEDPNKRLECKCIPKVDTAFLRESGEFKAQVLVELGEDRKLDIRPFFRRYIESLCDIHTQIRVVADPLIKKSDAIILPVISNNPPPIRLVAKENDIHTETKSLFMEMIERRKNFAKKNSNLDHLSLRFASGVSP